MKKDAIKIVKRNKKNEAEKAEAAVDTLKAVSVTQQRIVNAVNNWISERRENSRAEKVFSDAKIMDWAGMSENFK